MGRGDYLLNYKLPVESIRDEMNIPNLSFSEIYSINLYLVVSRRTDNAAEVLHASEQKFLEITQEQAAEGKIDQQSILKFPD